MRDGTEAQWREHSDLRFLDSFQKRFTLRRWHKERSFSLFRRRVRLAFPRCAFTRTRRGVTFTRKRFPSPFQIAECIKSIAIEHRNFEFPIFVYHEDITSRSIGQELAIESTMHTGARIPNSVCFYRAGMAAIYRSELSTLEAKVPFFFHTRETLAGRLAGNLNCPRC